MRTNQRVHEIVPMSPAATMGVMPPVSRIVEESRFTEFNSIITARASGAPRGTRASSSAWSYTCTRMPVRALAEGSRSVRSGIARSRWR